MKTLAWEDIVEGLEASVSFSVTDDDMRAFADLSGDRNPLHTDEAFARAKGFEGRAVYGGLILAQVSRLLGMELPGRDVVWASVKMDFRNPLYLHEEAVVQARVAGKSEAAKLIDLKITVTVGGRKIATGRANAILVPLV